VGFSLGCKSYGRTMNIKPIFKCGDLIKSWEYKILFDDGGRAVRSEVYVMYGIFLSYSSWGGRCWVLDSCGKKDEWNLNSTTLSAKA